MTMILPGCTGLFFYPTQREYLRSEDLGLRKEEVFFPGRGGKLSGWWMPAAGEAKGTILFVHGNAENVTSHVASVHWLPERGWNVFALDYRGYGKSEGAPTVHGCIEDTEDALDWVRARSDIDPGKVFLFGQSIGGVFALNTAFKNENRAKFRALIVDSAFSSFPGIVRDKLRQFWITWALQYPFSIFTSGAYDPLPRMGELEGIPILFIHGEADPIVEVYHSDRLFAAAGAPKEYWRVPGAGHIEVLRNVDFRKRFVDFLNARL